ncbi:hypothetical protein A6B43_08020 [Vespertiliibacter pulmonis]|uniref:Uncharacterized protein (DUF1919 family) n=1 Tax=Vespertiliibacter pulmonis TaxID=1443036 RepID=A0A3N4W8L5_9PAST|nr:DUF1919 domain-containing protein [Vespertiliibacter pulmonis]QLB21471.1 hypothetical protein A6B43_08020 [Vespertiliibacter pulmonis]RPE85887.1 uncharacterized protein (DUF1919 family) [Vespertiliibacter pulmonis]
MVLFKKLTKVLNDYLRNSINQQNQQRLINKEMTIISSNCTGGFLLHDLKMQFNSPFVNLYLTPDNFIRYLQNIEFYQRQPLTFIPTDKPYPVGQLADIKIHFMHYKNEQEARQKWQIRTKRMQLDNLFIIMTDRDNCTQEHLTQFDQLPFKHKIVFTHKPYPEIKSSFYISGFEHNEMVGDLFEYTGLNGKRYYDQFDYVNWFNQFQLNSI